MSEIGQVILYSFASGATVILGVVLARLKAIPVGRFSDEISHSVIAFGGGLLVAAVAFVLAPKGIKELSLPVLVLAFFLGVICALSLDRFVSRRGGKTAQLMAMLMDFIPEAIALGAIFAVDKQAGLKLAVFIGLQNLPESYNSFSDLIASGFSPGKASLILVPFSLIGVAGALAGYLLLAQQQQLVAGLLVFAAGAILYLVFQDIAPMARLKNHWAPATGATLGFMLGMIIEKLLGA